MINERPNIIVFLSFFALGEFLARLSNDTMTLFHQLLNFIGSNRFNEFNDKKNNRFLFDCMEIMRNIQYGIQYIQKYQFQGVFFFSR